MANKVAHEASIPNPALAAMSVLLGEWNTVGSHPSIPDILHGHTSFEWLEGGAFLMMHSDIVETGVPTAVAIIGSDNVLDQCFMIYFDERGISRKYEMSLRGDMWKIWRTAPKFSQRFTGTFADGGDTIIGVWELCEDDTTWKRDLELTYRRVK